MGDAEKLKQHPLLEKLISQKSGGSGGAATAGLTQSGDPQPPSVRAVTGYLARDSQPGRWRVYLTLDFDQYLTIDESDIVSSELLATADDPTKPHVVWVKSTANLQLTTVSSQQVQAQFLTGSLASQFSSAVSKSAPGRFSPNLRQDTQICTRIPDGMGCGPQYTGYCTYEYNCTLALSCRE